MAFLRLGVERGGNSGWISAESADYRSRPAAGGDAAENKERAGDGSQANTYRRHAGGDAGQADGAAQAAQGRGHSGDGESRTRTGRLLFDGAQPWRGGADPGDVEMRRSFDLQSDAQGIR